MEYDVVEEAAKIVEEKLRKENQIDLTKRVTHLERPGFAHVAYSFVSVREEKGIKIFEVSTIGIQGVASFLDPFLGLRNDLFGIRDNFETMVFEADAKGERVNGPLHCVGYRTRNSALKGHGFIINLLLSRGPDFLNGGALENRESFPKLRQRVKSLR